MSRGVFHARRPVKSAQQLRRDWVSAISLTISACADAAGPPAIPVVGNGQTLTRLAVALRDLTPGNFPSPMQAARSAAGAYLLLARDFVDARVGPETRTACASFLRAGAACLDGFIEQLQHAEAQVTRRMLGERDEA